MNHPNTPCVRRLKLSSCFIAIQIMRLNDLSISLFRSGNRICEIKVPMQSFYWEVLQLLSLVIADVLLASFLWYLLLNAGTKITPIQFCNESVIREREQEQVRTPSQLWVCMWAPKAVLGASSRQLEREFCVVIKSEDLGQTERGPAVGRAQGSQTVF